MLGLKYKIKIKTICSYLVHLDLAVPGLNIPGLNPKSHHNAYMM